MFYVHETTDEGQADYLNSALRRYGVDSFVAPIGPNAEGRNVYGIACPLASEAEQARYLLYSNRAFIGDLHPDAASEISEKRARKNAAFVRLMTSNRILKASGLMLLIVLGGYLLGL
ncbi:hypothetical protein [Stutzerimonas stutzeri]|uniref:DUF2007 domain-containing protein n=1 Tax=Stutzerimonas stutzeri TaxID=316 RepID=A0A0D9AN20_STUST|nr:hypothetical protein [Stutzerimonas stutzeri]KJH82142.1 hypothetical protein UF78_10400 [Stutzerimonas stutzeri]